MAVGGGDWVSGGEDWTRGGEDWGGAEEGQRKVEAGTDPGTL